MLTSNDLLALATRADRRTAAGCPTCAALVCPGWESVPGGFDTRSLLRIGTLRDAAVEEPTIDEHLPAGVHGWSPDAPVDPAYFPYNRCDVHACSACRRPFLRYTEYGGYYVDERIRELRADRIVGG